VRIRLNDVNDYVPVIQNLPLKAKVKENLPAGTFIIKIVAEDEDMGYNAATEIFLDEVCGPLTDGKNILACVFLIHHVSHPIAA